VSVGLDAVKKTARISAASVREAAHDKAKDSAPAALAARGLPIPRDPQNHIVSVFHSFGTEISTAELFDRLVSEGWTTALPVVVAKNTPLLFRQWAPGDALVLGRWDIQIPADTALQVEPDVLLVPMLAFDRKGYRMGYGGGFYDRTLAKLRALKKVTAIGIAYAGQEIDMVPRDGHDQPLDWIMTERETFKCG
jgi:5-formyltetrahydrofolate cyclo-ligase